MYLRSAWQGKDKDIVSAVRHVYELAKTSEHNTRPQILTKAIEGAAGLVDLTDKTKALFEYIVRLTVWPQSMAAEHIKKLRDVGWTEAEMSAINLVAACFAFMNTLADGTGVRLLEDKRDAAKELFGEQAWEKHLKWADGRS